MVRRFNSTAAALFLIVAAGALIYANSLRGEFVYDDELVVKDNTFFSKPGNVKHLITKDYYGGSGEYSYRPALTLTYFIDHHFWKFNPVGYHITNLFFHIAAAVLLYFFIALLVPVIDPKLPSRIIALLAGVIFVMHPINTEVVNGIAFRDDAVFAFFFFPFLIFYLKAKTSMGARRISFYIISLVSFLLSMLSKELAIFSLFLLPVIDFISPGYGKKEIKRYNFTMYAAYIFIVIAYFYVITSVLANPVVGRHASSLLKALTVKDLFILGSQRIVWYIALLIFPFNLSVEYLSSRVPDLFSPKVLMSMMAVGALGVVTLKRLKKDPLFAFSVAFIILFASPAIVYTYNDIAERFLYLPSAGYALLLSLFIFRAYGAKQFRETTVIVVALLIAAYGCRVVTRNEIWRTPLKFWYERVQHSPATARAYASLGNAYRELGRNQEAEAQYRLAIKISPDYADGHNNLGNIYYDMQRYGDAAREITRALELNPGLSKAHSNLGNLYLKTGDYKKAIDEYEIFLKQEPFNYNVNNNLGSAYLSVGRYDDAVKQFKRALDVRPDSVDYLLNLANTYAAKKEFEEAAHIYKSILGRGPDDFKARLNLSNIYAAQNRYDDAIAELNKVIAEKPDYAEAYYNLGNTYFKKGSYDDAIREYEKAIKLEPNYTDCYDNMGVAYLKKGMVDKSVELWEKVISIDPGNVKARKKLEAVRAGAQ